MWTTPEGWSETQAGPTKGVMAELSPFATFRVGPDALKLTITRLGAKSAALLPNVNRWRKNDLNLLGPSRPFLYSHDQPYPKDRPVRFPEDWKAFWKSSFSTAVQSSWCSGAQASNSLFICVTAWRACTIGT